jgi:type II secretory ATPase GspE/PulE/Tfp pilus assembly ATPase PilB-like protein
MGVPVPGKAWTAAGCEACGGSGYSGRTGVFEIWPFDEASYDLVQNGEDEHGLRQHLRKSGLRPLFREALEKAVQGVIPISELRGLGVLSPS